MEYDVTFPELTADMVDELLNWVESRWGGADLATVKVLRSDLDTNPSTR